MIITFFNGCCFFSKQRKYQKPVADMGRGADASFPQGFDPLPTQRAPFVIFWKIQFWMSDMKTFLKAPSAPIYDNFEGGARRKNAIFCSKVFKNCIKTPFLACFLKKLTAAQKIWSKWGLYSYLGELKKINMVDLKKEVEKSFLKIREFFENHFFFWKSAPPPSKNS